MCAALEKTIITEKVSPANVIVGRFRAATKVGRRRRPHCCIVPNLPRGGLQLCPEYKDGEV